MRLLLVDDDPGLRALLRTTLEVFDVELAEAASAEEAVASIRKRKPDAIVLGVGLPDMDGLALCRSLKRAPLTRDVPVVLLTGHTDAAAVATEAGADAFVLKPFSPLELLGIVERVVGGLYEAPAKRDAKQDQPQEQLRLYARDLRHLLELEREQRLLLQDAYHDTVAALASALESKDTGTREHSQRVQRYAAELAREMEPELVENPSVEYGFLLHDVGKIGIPDRVLLKPRRLSPNEQRLMQTHTLLGEQMLQNVTFLQGEGLRIVRSHHERWDGTGYPDGLGGDEIPLGARIFSLADTLDAITSHRPYRRARSWSEARAEIAGNAGAQFDPSVVEAFGACEPALRAVARQFDG
jgi:response regulator RpfG family c-di-GMP phosphodiesterase